MRSLVLAGLLLAAPAALAAAPAPPDARALKEEGDRRRKAGDAEGALQSYREALLRFAGYAEAHEAVGELRYGQKRYPEALEAFGAAVEIDPAYALAWYNLAFAARKSGDLPRARGAYERYVKLRPADPDGHFGLAETLRGLGEREAAAREYQLFIDLAKATPAQAPWVEKARSALAELSAQPARPAAPPPEAGAGVGIGALLAGAQAGPAGGALSAGASSVAASPAPTPAAPAAGAATATSSAAVKPASPAAPQGTTSAPAATPAPPPIAALAPSASAAPSQALVEKLGAGDRAFLAGDHRGALFLYQDAVYLDPGSTAARIRLARAYASLRHPDMAEAQLQQVLAQEPGNAEARQQLDELRATPPRGAAIGAPAAATAGATAAASAPAAAEAATAGGAGPRVYRFTPEAGPPPVPGPPPARPAQAGDPLPAPPPPATPAPDAGPTAADLYRVGVAQVGRREFALAVDSLNRALEKDPGLSVAFEARASARFGLGQYREAAADYQTARESSPGRASPIWGLAECYRLLADRRAAETYALYAESGASDVVEAQRDVARKRANELRPH